MFKDRGEHKILKIANLIAFIGVLVLNFLANYLPLNNKSTAELSDSYPNLLVPSGFTFAIWGVIYIYLAAFIIYQFMDPGKGGFSDRSGIESVGIFFVISCIGNMAWIVLWHFEFVGESLIAMIVILLSLIAIYIRVNSRSNQISSTEKVFISYPFSIYLGWITLATILNITAFLVDRGWNGFGISEQIWTLAIFAAVIILSFISIKTRRDILYNLVFIWALFGIAYRHLEELDLQYRMVYWGAIISTVIIVLMILKVVFLDKRKDSLFKF